MKRRLGIGVSGMILGLSAALGAATVPASATDGYFQVGFGMRQGGMGGAGVADSTDAMAQTLNPAGIVGVGDQWQLGVAAFLPYRGYDASGTLLVQQGSVDSEANFFLMPNFAYVRQIDDQSAWGISVYGNGGMNTTYASTVNNSAYCNGGMGVFCGGDTGVDLMQAFVSLDYARQMGSLKVGIAPTFAAQRFRAKGLYGFGQNGGSILPGSVSDNGYDYSFGGGLRAGLEWEAMPGLRFGLSGQTKMYMTKFDKYAGLFAERGGFDIPAAVTAGVAFDVSPDLTLALDYQRIFYSGVASISNSSLLQTQLGSDNGRGFGWHDVDVFKIGAEWRANETWTLRAGYAYSDNPVQSADVMFNILAPGIVQHHITAGASYKLSDRDTIEFSGMYVPETTISGIEMTSNGPTQGSNITLNMHQFQFGFGWTRKY